MIRIACDEKESLKKAQDYLEAGEVIIVPTETVYGIGALSTNGEACSKIYEAKGRPSDNPLITHVGSLKVAERFGEMHDQARKLASAFWPGPLTIIVKDAGIAAPTVTAGTGKIGLRMPSHPWFVALLQALDTGVAAPSANVSGRPSGTHEEHILEDFQDSLVVKACFLEEGHTSIGLESTIVDLSDPDQPMLVREGAITLEQLQAYLPTIELKTIHEEGMTVSPGLKYRHYAPKGKLVLLHGEGSHVEDQISYLLKKHPEAMWLISEEHAGLIPDEKRLILSSLKDPETASRRFFSHLRSCDQRGATMIICEMVSEEGIGRALRERMRKAAG